MTTFNWGYLNSSTTPLEIDGDAIKDRSLVDNPTYGLNGKFITDQEYDGTLQLCAQDASNEIDNILTYFTSIIASEDTSPPTNTKNPAYWKLSPVNCPLVIKQICADFAASYFKRRVFNNEVHLNVPTVVTDNKKSNLSADYWYAQGLSKLMQFIESYYKKPTFHIITSDESVGFGTIGGYEEVT